MTTLNIIGYIAAIGTTFAFIPQAYKVYQTKKTGDLSFVTFLIFSFGLVMWIITELCPMLYRLFLRML